MGAAQLSFGDPSFSALSAVLVSLLTQHPKRPPEDTCFFTIGIKSHILYPNQAPLSSDAYTSSSGLKSRGAS